MTDRGEEPVELELMSLKRPPTAIFCGNDVIALGALNAARALGLSVPDQLTVIRFDDIPMAGWEAFELTTLRTDLPALSDGAVGLLLDRIRDPGIAARQVRLDPVLVTRGSHGPPAR